MNTAPQTSAIYALVLALNAEAERSTRRVSRIIERVVDHEIGKNPRKAKALQAAADSLFKAVALNYAESERVLSNGGKALDHDRILRHATQDMLDDAMGTPFAVLSAAEIKGHYHGYDQLLQNYQRAQGNFLRALADPA